MLYSPFKEGKSLGVIAFELVGFGLYGESLLAQELKPVDPLRPDAYNAAEYCYVRVLRGALFCLETIRAVHVWLTIFDCY